jgi:hypothetical protein
MPAEQVFCVWLIGYFVLPPFLLNLLNFIACFLRWHYYTTGKNISTPYFKKFFTVLKYGLFMRYFKGFKYSRTSTNLDLSQFL